MSAQMLALDRVEFDSIKIEANDGEFSRDEVFPQVSLELEKLPVQTRSDLFYPDDQVEDPCVFILTYGIRIGVDAEDSDLSLPYSLEIEAVGYFRYLGGDEFQGADRFRAVRFSGYQILYGAIREMVCNLTARGRHGLWHLPAKSFSELARSRSAEDEEIRQEKVKKMKAGVGRSRAKKSVKRGSGVK